METYGHSRILVEMGKMRDDPDAGLLSQPTDYEVWTRTYLQARTGKFAW